jgi:hypothetical protein
MQRTPPRLNGFRISAFTVWFDQAPFSVIVFLSPRRMHVTLVTARVCRRASSSFLYSQHCQVGRALVPALSANANLIDFGRTTPKPYRCIGFGDIQSPKPYRFKKLGDIHLPRP